MIRLCPRHAARAACAAAGLAVGASVFFSPPSPAAAAAVVPSPASIVVRWLADTPSPGRATVVVTGLAAADLLRLQQTDWTPSEWQRLFAVYADAGGSKPESPLPPMLGRYRTGPDGLRFEPQFPLASGIVYRAVFNPGQLGGETTAGSLSVGAVYQLPARATGPGTVVSGIYPSADVLPENLLKFYLHFSAPMSRGHIYQHIHLQDDTGKEVELPFLELDQELWDPAMERLTLLLDPGRIKRGVRPLEENGSALQVGRIYTLVIDRDWQDATGQPLRENQRKTFRVGPADRDPPNPAQWQIQPPTGGTRAPLIVKFPDSMDHALALRLIRVAGPVGPTLEGTAALDDQERRWTFTPAAPWPQGAHRLIIATTIEDLAGNNVGKPFDVDVFENVQRSLASETVELPFVIH